MDDVVWLGLIATRRWTMKASSTTPGRWGDWRCGCAVAALLVFAHPACSQMKATIRSADVRITLSAGLAAPKLDLLAGANGVAWSNTIEESLPATVEMRGAQVAVHWSLLRSACRVETHRVEFVYESSSPNLLLHWMWEARDGYGPVEHSIAIENRGGEEVWLPLTDSLRLDWNSAGSRLQHLFVEKGADTPSAEGTHLEAIDEGYRWVGRSSTYAHPVQGEAREIIPVEFVFSADGEREGWYAGIEFSGRTRITLDREGNHLRSTLGLNGEAGSFKTRLAAHGSFVTPRVFLGAFSGGADGAANQLRPWVRRVLGNRDAWNDPRYPVTVSNSWGSGMQVDEALAMRMMTDAQELGLEMFHLDAGWFRGVGDWYPDAKKFPHGLAYLADQAHQRGLRFGMWVDWSQAGVSTNAGSLNVHDPRVRDWLVNDTAADWKPEEFKGQTIDLGVPAAHDYAAREVKRIVEDYHLDMLEHDGYLVAQGCVQQDHPHAAVNRSSQHVLHDSGFDFVSGANATDVSYHAVRAYYDIYERLRREHPGLLLEICNDGGRMMDFGSAAHGDYFSITDTYDPLSNRRAFYDASYALPAAMLESYIERWNAPANTSHGVPTPSVANFKYMLRSGMMGWMTMMLDTTTWTPEQHDVAKKAFTLYKEKLRPLIRDANLYHISERPDGVHWDGLEYWDTPRKLGVVYAFRGSTPDEASHRFVLKGLDAKLTYRLHFEDGSDVDHEVSGNELVTKGVMVRLNEPNSSELLFLSVTP
jgi:alpha-galactosidase